MSHKLGLLVGTVLMLAVGAMPMQAEAAKSGSKSESSKSVSAKSASKASGAKAAKKVKSAKAKSAKSKKAEARVAAKSAKTAKARKEARAVAAKAAARALTPAQLQRLRERRAKLVRWENRLEGKLGQINVKQRGLQDKEDRTIDNRNFDEFDRVQAVEDRLERRERDLADILQDVFGQRRAIDRQIAGNGGGGGGNGGGGNGGGGNGGGGGGGNGGGGGGNGGGGNGGGGNGGDDGGDAVASTATDESDSTDDRRRECAYGEPSRGGAGRLIGVDRSECSIVGLGAAG